MFASKDAAKDILDAYFFSKWLKLQIVYTMGLIFSVR